MLELSFPVPVLTHVVFIVTPLVPVIVSVADVVGGCVDTLSLNFEAATGFQIAHTCACADPVPTHTCVHAKFTRFFTHIYATAQQCDRMRMLPSNCVAM